ncbi:MAG: MFS transporter [Chloroflexi bacterium]|nr:MFS transporter [Chloroflexota bacterium]
MRVWTSRRPRRLDLLWPRTTGDTVSDNIMFLYADVLWSSLLTGIVQTFLSVYLLRLGGTALQVGLLVSLPSIGGTLLSLRAVDFVRRHRSDIRLSIVPPFLWRLGYPFIALVPLLPKAAEGWTCIAIIFLCSFPTIISNIAIVSQIGDILPLDKRASVLSWRNTLAGMTTTLSAFIGGFTLSLLPLPINYQVVFASAFAVSLIGLYHRSRLVLPKPPDDELQRQSRLPIRAVLQRPSFRRFSGGILLYLAGLYLPQAIFSIYLVKNLHALDSQIGLAATLGSLAATLSYPFWGRLLSRNRLRKILPIACIGWGLFPALVSLTPNMVVYSLVAIYANLFGSGVSTSVTQTLIEIGPPDERPARIALYNTFVGGAGVLLPVLGTILLSVIGIHLVLVLAAVFRVLAGLTFATIPEWKADSG